MKANGVLHQVAQIFRRYVVEHLDLRKPGFPLLDEQGHSIGYVDTLRISGNRLQVAGWCDAERVALVTDSQRVDCAPDLFRPDVAASRGGNANSGFRLDIPHFASRVTLVMEWPGVRHFHVLSTFEDGDLWRARLKMALPFVRDVAGVVPAAIRWKLRGDPADKAAIKAALGFGAPRPLTQALAADLFDAGAAQDSAVLPGRVTLIMPVYNAFEVLQESLDRVRRHTDMDWHLIVVEDCSTDPRVRPWLRDWAAAAPSQTTLIENAANLGFIGAVNLALARARDRGDPVILLNSDALVPQAWASRLVRPLVERADVASVTPMSNDAEIFSVPVICARSDLNPGDADVLDAVAQRFTPHHTAAQAPTGVGFCMALSPKYLSMVPTLDTAFGRGYGEEVDWCQKVRARGGQHLGIANLFVEHRGGGSFGSADKQKLVAANNAIISRRYPRYDQEVQDFIRQDPLAAPRLALAVLLAARRQPPGTALPVYLAHSLGGGADHYLADRIAGDVARGGSAIVLRVGGAHRWQLEVHGAGGKVLGVTQDFALLEQLLSPVTHRRIVYSCGVGAGDPLRLPEALLTLAEKGKHRIEVLFHDFLPISPSYTLLNAKGLYTGLPAPDTDDPAHESRSADGKRVSLAVWQQAWGNLVRAAEELVVFSDDSAAKVAAVWPDCAGAIVQRPHPIHHEIPRLAPPDPKGRQPVIGVLGNIGLQKGAAVLVDLSRELAARGVADLVVLGNFDPGFKLVPPAKVHGSYLLRDIPYLVARYNVTCWLIPSIWPETFSFTTREVLATGLPVWCFDLGAQGEAVKEAVANGAPGGVIPLTDGRPPIADMVDHILKLPLYEGA